jgi:signal transduction histidine kinase
MPKALSQTLEGIDRISAIVAAMKDFSHPGLEKTLCDLNRAIASTITVARNEWKYVADVQTHFDPDLPFVSVMPSALNQVILNLLVNATQAIASCKSRQSEEKGLIEISTQRVEGSVEIRIRDSGCGIPADIQDRIFDPFFTTKEVGKGTGQGLAISRDVIVNKHGGSIWMESVIDVGTTFVLRLPFDRSTCPELVMA